VFHGIVDLAAEENIALYGVVIPLTAVILSFAYHSATLVWRKRLLDQREGGATGATGKMAAAAAKAEMQRAATNEARYFAIFVVNAAYLAMSLLGAFFVFARFGFAVNFTLSLSLPAAALSYAFANLL
jgi:hypothetical protein